MNDIRLLYIDLFCGAGGTSTGVESARHDGRKCAKVIACVNHDANAIASHAANHPDAVHFTEDIRTLNLAPMVMHLERMKKRYPEAHVVLWASLECTNFSKAKGGQPRDADSRTLAEHLFRYIEALRPDFLQIENVEEFMCWGDLDENGKPVSRDKGRCYVRWVNAVRGYGYDYDWRILNAADYGAYTSRRRFFGQFARKGLPISFPVQTHAKMPDNLYPNKDNPKGFYPTPDWHELFPGFYLPWKPVRDVLDLQDEGTSIFGKKKPLCEKTLERIYAGLVKFVAGGKKQHEAWILKYNSMNQQHHHNAPSIDEPCPTVAVQNRLGIVKVNFLSKQFGGDPMGKNQGIDRPAGTVTCRDHHAFITAYYTPGTNTSIEEPNPTVTTMGRHALVVADGIDLDRPMPDVPLDKVKLLSRQFIANEYSGGGQISDLDDVCPAILTTPKQKVVSADQFLMNPQYQCEGSSIEKPCFTLIARMDKMPPYLVTTEHGDLGIAIYESDSPMTRKVKEFMAMYGIIDVKMRMLNIRELKRIMGFPEDYTLVGTQAEQKKYIGNAVEVGMARVLCEALCEELNNKQIRQ
ncbi:MAG: DNA cytosine methyltransferase [Prevotella sp.]|nr:DNA cytosine methyltransferase [Prevotella sp.]